MGSLGWIQGIVFGAAPGIQDPFPADVLPRLRLGLVPTAVNLVGRERTLVGNRECDHICGNGVGLLPEPGIPVALHPPKPSPLQFL